MDKVLRFEKSYISSLNQNQLPHPGDLIEVGVQISEGTSSRVQLFQGICIGVNKCRVGTNFLVKKENDGIVTLRTFMLYSPLLKNIKIIKKHKVRRAKLYYLLNLIGKKAKLKSLDSRN